VHGFPIKDFGNDGDYIAVRIYWGWYKVMSFARGALPPYAESDSNMKIIMLQEREVFIYWD